MAGHRHTFAARMMPSFGDLAFAMPLLLLFVRLGGGSGLLADADTAMHIRTGDWILAHGRIPSGDMFSFSKAGQPWFAWEWLSDVIFAALHEWFGVAGVVLLGALLIAGTYAVLYRSTLHAARNVLVAFAAVMLAMAASTLHWLARPHVFTLFFFAVWCLLLERARLGETRWLFALPLLALLWANLHGGFVAGILLTAVYAIGELASCVACTDVGAWRRAWRRAAPFVFTTALCAAATLVNPYGYRLHVHIAGYLTDARQLAAVDEFRSADFTRHGGWQIELLLILGIAASAWSFARGRVAQGLAAAAWIHPALTSARHIPLFAIVATPAIAQCCAEWLAAAAASNINSLVRKPALAVAGVAREIGEIERLPRWHSGTLAAALAASLFVLRPAPLRARPLDFEAAGFPAHAVGALRASRLRNVFTTDQWGDYVIYKCYPAAQVFIDGRSDFYGADFDRIFLGIMRLEPGWRERLGGYAVDAALLPRKSALAGALSESPGWERIYADNQAVVLRRNEVLRR